MGQKPSFWHNSKLFSKGIICPFRANVGQPLLGSRWSYRAVQTP